MSGMVIARVANDVAIPSGSKIGSLIPRGLN
jgi:hypothetical protein